MKTSFFFTHLLIIQFFLSGNTQSLMIGNPSDSICVMRMICESERYQWIGTDRGLLLRDIQTRKELLITKEKTVLPSNKIICGVCLPDGRTYIGTTKGIAYCDNHSLFRIDTENSDLTENNIKDMMLDQKNNVWVKTINGRVGMITGKNVTMLKRKNHYLCDPRGWHYQSPFKESGTNPDCPNCDPENIIR